MTKGMTSARQIIHQRRSLLACDGVTSIPAARFYRMLARAMPTPWDAIPWEPAIHFALFVHRVDGIEPGLYALARDAAKVANLKAAMHAHFAWEAPPGCPAELPLFLLERGDARLVATQVSCRQDIAGDGAFSLGMIAEYREKLVAHGPRSTGACSGKRARSARCCSSRQKPPACARPASAASSTIPCTRCSAFATSASSRSIASPSAATSTIRASPRWRPMSATGPDGHLMPACMNDCMNCRWKRRNATSSGATPISVPALITDQSDARLGRAEDGEADTTLEESFAFRTLRTSAYSSYSSEPCTQMNDCRSIMSRGRRSRTSSRTRRANSSRLA